MARQSMARQSMARPHRPTEPPAPGAESGGPSDSESPGSPDPGLAGFAAGGVWDSAPPSAARAVALEGAAGEGWRCEGGSRAETVGAVRAAAALESWWCAAKLGLIRAAIREDDDGLGGGYHGDLPDEWSKSLTTEIALALAMSPVSAEKLMQTAWDLGALLPGIGALLEDGTLTYPKARAVSDALELLSEPDKARAEAMIADRLAGRTFGQVDKLAAQAAITLDPGLAERTREHAERNRARVMLRRERSGAASLSGYDLPPAESLAAHAATCARAQLYKDSGAFPGVFMDQLRAMAYLDLINQISAEARIAAGPPDVGLGAPGESAFRDEPEPDDPGAPAPDGSGGSDCPCAECDGRCAPPGPEGDEPGRRRTRRSRPRGPWGRWRACGDQRPPSSQQPRRRHIVTVVRAARVPAPAQANRPDHPPGHPPRPPDPAGREPRLRPARPCPVPRPGRARRRQPPHHRLRHSHRSQRLRHRPRLPAIRPPPSAAPPARPRIVDRLGTGEKRGPRPARTAR